MICWFGCVDTMNFFERTIFKDDTIFKKIYFSDSTVYLSEISIKDIAGNTIEHTQEIQRTPKVSSIYYSNGLVKEEIFAKPGFSPSRIVYKYKDSNFKTETHFYKNGDATEPGYENTFDKSMNWICQNGIL